MASLAPLAARLNALCDPHPFHIGWYLKDLSSGHTANRHGDDIVPSASTRKIAILMTALRAVAAGQLSLEQPVTIEARYQVSRSGTFQHFRPGFTLTLHDVLTMMIIVSDNACTGTVVDMLGLDTINEFSRAAGMHGTTHREGIPAGSRLDRAAPEGGPGAVNETTPADVGLLLELILRGAHDDGGAARLGCPPELCRLALDILSWQMLNTRLPFLLPLGTRVAHKTGTNDHCYNDAGIVYRADRPHFILTVYTQRVPRELPEGASPWNVTAAPGATALLIAHLARTCWDALPM